MIAQRAFTVEQFTHVIGEKYGGIFHAVCLEFDITTRQRQNMFLAQVYHESDELTLFEENLRYSAKRLCAVWPKRFPTLEAALPYQHAPQKLANLVYAGRLGNGSPDSGDGWKYRGRGGIQITGRANYLKCSQPMGVNLLEHPELLATNKFLQIRSAGYFWDSRDCNAAADEADFSGVTRRINGGLIGLGDRLRLLQHFEEVL